MLVNAFQLRCSESLKLDSYVIIFSMKNLIKKNGANITVALMLLWGIGMAFVLPPTAAATFFCVLIVPTTYLTAGKKYAIPFAVVGGAWLMIAIIINANALFYV